MASQPAQSRRASRCRRNATSARNMPRLARRDHRAPRHVGVRRQRSHRQLRCALDCPIAISWAAAVVKGQRLRARNQPALPVHELANRRIRLRHPAGAAAVYEMRLFFVSPFSVGEEKLAGFNVALNGKPLLNAFDVNMSANGADVADEQVFRDVAPGEDGFLRLWFSNHVGSPMLNGAGAHPRHARQAQADPHHHATHFVRRPQGAALARRRLLSSTASVPPSDAR